MVRTSTQLAVAATSFTAIVLASGSASAHFELVSPSAYSVQDAEGSPQLSAPCGQADPTEPIQLTGDVTTVGEGATVSITIIEKVTHPGWYRVAIADDISGLPMDPTVTPGTMACGTAVIESPPVLPVISDDDLDHTSAFTGPQTFQVQLPAGYTCQGCVLQVIEFMSDHPLNNPGGCFYHHCATLNIEAGAGGDGGVSSADAGTSSADAGSAAAATGGGGGCDAGTGAGFGFAAIALGATIVVRRRRG